jgi:uncharacterized C2H2 Zn-finger protein
MVKRYCPKCNAEFDRKYCYDRHINKKFNCSPNNNHSIVLNDEKTDNLIFCKNLQEFADLNIDKKIVQKNYEISDLTETNNLSINTNDTCFSCSYCNKNYSSKYTLSRHLNDSCKIKRDIDNEKENSETKDLKLLC